MFTTVTKSNTETHSIQESGHGRKEHRRVTVIRKKYFPKNFDSSHFKKIKAVGKTGTLNAPSNAKVVDCTGKTITPGFVDTHAHMWPFWGMHKENIWIYAANLAYGVTTTRDPQTATTDVLTYGDMVDAGQIPGHAFIALVLV